MTDVKRLLAEATPLPWEVGKPSLFPAGRARLTWNGQELFATSWREKDTADAALIVHVVNNLPAYEEAVEALEAVQRDYYGDVPCWCDTEVDEHSEACVQARAALARLRGDA